MWGPAPLPATLTLGGLHLAVATTIHAAIVVTAAGAGGPVLRRLEGRTAGAVMGGGILLVALWMAWETR